MMPCRLAEGLIGRNGQWVFDHYLSKDEEDMHKVVNTDTVLALNIVLHIVREGVTYKHSTPHEIGTCAPACKISAVPTWVDVSDYVRVERGQDWGGTDVGGKLIPKMYYENDVVIDASGREGVVRLDDSSLMMGIDWEDEYDLITDVINANGIDGLNVIGTIHEYIPAWYEKYHG